MKFHKYRVEWELPDKNGTEANNYTETFGYIRWFLDDQFILEVKGEGLNASGTGAEISSEPMYILLNTAISSQWGEYFCCSLPLFEFGLVWLITMLMFIRMLQGFHQNVQQCVHAKHTTATEGFKKHVVSPRDFVKC